MSEEPVPESVEWMARHSVKRLPQCPRCGTTPPEIVVGERGPECADCGSQSTDLFLWESADADLAWAVQRVKVLALALRKDAGTHGAKLLRGHGYPNQVMSDAMDALALETVLAALQRGQEGR